MNGARGARCALGDVANYRNRPPSALQVGRARVSVHAHVMNYMRRAGGRKRRKARVLNSGGRGKVRKFSPAQSFEAGSVE